METTFRRLDPACLTMKLKVHIAKEFWVRLWLAKKVFMIGAWILNVGIEIEEIA